MGLRLYQITDTTSKKPIEGLYFSDKKLAKAKRRELNGADETMTPSQSLRYVVSPGPDHHNYHGTPSSNEQVEFTRTTTWSES